MPSNDPRVTAYIEKAPAFAQPILKELRARMHRAVPTVEETIKWGSPFFLVGGRILASTAAFKQHAKFGLWPNGMKGPPEFLDLASADDLPAAGAFEKRIASVAKTLAAPKGKPATSAKRKAAKPAAKGKTTSKTKVAKKPAAKGRSTHK